MKRQENKSKKNLKTTGKISTKINQETEITKQSENERTKSLVLKVTPQMHREMKTLAGREGRFMTEILEEAWKEYYQKHKKKFKNQSYLK
ncbi:hypothetical protein [endosymbiont GvMRE of Glomus versiforme]|uniref:hypothetical protein n=1 Tax=endosymbiont GvMRE of Glomus versiforme TaxID=2039283 RepID=UPI0011C3E9D6|nr:hypothetical protein [endosymbiont GvMRE of Glomus versiforme]